MSIAIPGGEAPVQCSAAGCRADAAWAVHWRNPRIHGIERVKTWLACDAHREHLASYLSTRGFPVAVTPVGETVEQVS
jgi:hypothetical protein